ncbi:hypothetical protein [Neobacillus massiliamazoniensis]|jgi:hypothetical protein|uniref:Uncharacterized protein n=1 Tax=Neobacillus massiliamazoniensis TaxID=1499688 RepID=A0A0U1NS28_9BACI|nr:hypothetical protein [Neobacillus massiliamazoniensis]CRK80824.1 hypothetical protein BN000_00713 [Neobacillus massiliamazoniensis]
MNRKFTGRLILAVAFICTILFIQSIPTSFAWYQASSNAHGQIVNAMTSDLMNINLGKVEYKQNGKISVSVTVKNISPVSIPLKVEWLLNNEVINTSSTQLKQKSSFVSKLDDVQFPSSSQNSLKCRIVGFNEGYISETMSIPLDQGIASEGANNNESKP